MGYSRGYLIFLITSSFCLGQVVSLFDLEDGLFPASLNLSKVTIDSLLEKDPATEKKINSQVNDLLKRFLKGDQVTVDVDQGDITFDSTLSDKVFSNSCSKNIRAMNPRVRGSLLGSSSLTTDVDSTDELISAFLQADLDAEIDLDFRFRAEVGAKIFRKCRRLFRDTLDISLSTSGKVDIQVGLEAKNVRYIEEENQLLMKFNLDLVLKGRPHGWNVDNLDVSDCDIKLGGRIKIGSYCSIIRGLLKSAVQQYLDKWTTFEAPKLVEKVEAKLKKKVGEEIVFKIFEF